MIAAILRGLAADARHSATAALGAALAAILFAHMILPGAAWLAFHEVRGTPPQPGGGDESAPPPVPHSTQKPLSP